MDFTSLITIFIAIVVIYFVIKFIVSPLIRIILGIIIFLILIYFLQRFFGFSLKQIFAPFGISLDLSKWGLNFNWILEPTNYYMNQIMDQIKNFLNL